MTIKYYKKLKTNLHKKVQQEYTNYFTKIILYKLIAINNNNEPNQIKKDKNYLESLMFWRILHQIAIKKPPYNSYKPITDEEKIMLPNDKTELHIPYIDQLYEIMNQRYDTDDQQYNPKIMIKNNYMILSKIKIKLDDRINFMLNYAKKMLHKFNKNESLSEELVMRCLLRYASLGLSGNHCSLSYSIYNYLYKNLNVKGEGFCSPLNSKLIEKKKSVICSLFKDTDKYFKSIGPFTNQVMLKHNTINWLLNPPFVTSLVKLAVNSIYDTLKESKLPMFIILVIPFTKIQNQLEKIYNKYLYGFINQKSIDIVSSKSNERKKINRENQKQYFVCNDKWSYQFENIYMYFFTNEDHSKIQLEQHMVAISNL